MAKVLGRGGGAAFYTKRSLGEPAVRPYGKTFPGRTQGSPLLLEKHSFGSEVMNEPAGTQDTGIELPGGSPLRKKYSFDREMVLP